MTPEHSEGWQRRRFGSGALRVGITVAPAIVSAGAAVALAQLVPDPRTTGGAVASSLGIVAASLVVLVLVDKMARRLLPLAALLQLTLVFPDQTPSRFRTALKAGSGRTLAKAVERARREGVSDDPSVAAQQLVLLATAIGDHDRRTRGHSERVRLYAELLAEELRLTEDERAKLQWAALIHDIGKIHVPVAILNKKGAPDAHEWEILRRHPMAGEELAAPVAPWLGEWVHAIGGHHERFDGSGYPRRLQGSDIPRSAAIVAVADSFEVMTAVRSYKKAMSLTDARAELTRCASSHFDPEVVRAFLNVSLGRIRRAMGLVGALAHVPFLGRVTTAAAYAPDVIPAASNVVSSTASSGLGAIALTGTLMTAPAPVAPAPAPAAAIEVVSDVAVPAEPNTGPVTFAARVADPTDHVSDAPAAPSSSAPAAAADAGPSANGSDAALDTKQDGNANGQLGAADTAEGTGNAGIAGIADNAGIADIADNTGNAGIADNAGNAGIADKATAAQNTATSTGKGIPF